LPILLTEDLMLRQWRADDLASLTALFADPGFSWYPYRRARTPAEAADFVRRAQRHWDDRDIGVWAVADRADSDLLGYAGVTGIDAGTWGADWEIGLRLAPPARGRGLGAQALTAALADVFGRIDADQVIATIEVGHTQSERLFRRVGMQASEQLPHPVFGTAHTVMRLTRQRWQQRAA
jgi:RimJ/RimL family protein N-acetyltransferase